MVIEDAEVAGRSSAARRRALARRTARQPGGERVGPGRPVPGALGQREELEEPVRRNGAEQQPATSASASGRCTSGNWRVAAREKGSHAGEPVGVGQRLQRSCTSTRSRASTRRRSRSSSRASWPRGPSPTLERAPTLLRWQAELLALPGRAASRVRRRPMADADRVSPGRWRASRRRREGMPS